MLVFTKLDFTFTTRHTHNWGSFLLRSSCFILSGAVSKCPLPIGHLPTWGGLISQHHLFALSFLGFLGFLQQEYWSGLPFLPPVDHVLSEFSTVTLPSWVALHGMVHSFIELCKPLQHDKAVIHDRCVCVCVCVCVYHIFCVHFYVDGHLGCFLVLALVNSAAVNIEVHAPFQITVLSRYMPRSGVIRWLFI